MHLRATNPTWVNRPTGTRLADTVRASRGRERFGFILNLDAARGGDHDGHGAARGRFVSTGRFGARCQGGQRVPGASADPAGSRCRRYARMLLTIVPIVRARACLGRTCGTAYRRRVSRPPASSVHAVSLCSDLEGLGTPLRHSHGQLSNDVAGFASRNGSLSRPPSIACGVGLQTERFRPSRQSAAGPPQLPESDSYQRATTCIPTKINHIPGQPPPCWMYKIGLAVHYGHLYKIENGP